MTEMTTQTHNTKKGASAYIIKSNSKHRSLNYNPQAQVSHILGDRPIRGHVLLVCYRRTAWVTGSEAHDPVLSEL